MWINPVWTEQSKTWSMVLILSFQTVNIPEVEASFGEAVAMPSSVSSEFLWLVSTHLDNARLQLALNIKCNTLCFQAKALLQTVPQLGRSSASKLIHHISIIQWDLDSRLLCHLIASVWSFRLLDWHWCSGSCHFRHRASYTHTRAALVGTITSLQGSDRGIIRASEVY